MIFHFEKYTSPDEVKSLYCGVNLPFEIRRTSQSIAFVNQHHSCLISNQPFYHKHFRLIARLKKEVGQNIKKIEIVTHSDSESLYLYNQNHFPGASGYLDLVRETDLSAAYVAAANQLGLISNELFVDLKKISKRFRLRILGSLGTKKYLSFYDASGNLLRESVEESPLRPAWLTIVAFTNSVMRQVSKSLHEQFVMYWVDNMFYVGKLNSLDAFESAGFEFKKFDRSLSYKKNRVVLTTTLNDRRFFTFPLAKII